MRISDWSSDVCSSDLGSSGRISPKPIRSTTTVRKIAGSMGRNLYDKGPKWPPQHCPRQAGPLLSARLLLCFFRFPGRRTEHEDQGRSVPHDQIGRAHVGTPVTNAHLVCRLLLDKTNRPTKNT